MYFFSNRRRIVVAGTGLLALALVEATPSRAAQLPASVKSVSKATTAQPVQAPARGYLTDIFFTAGERVKRGQILAKLTRPDGSPAYLLAPVPGRIGAARQHLGETLATHDTLALIDTSLGH